MSKNGNILGNGGTKTFITGPDPATAVVDKLAAEGDPVAQAIKARVVEEDIRPSTPRGDKPDKTVPVFQVQDPQGRKFQVFADVWSKPGVASVGSPFIAYRKASPDGMDSILAAFPDVVCARQYQHLVAAPQLLGYLVDVVMDPKFSENEKATKVEALVSQVRAWQAEMLRIVEEVKAAENGPRIFRP